MLNYFWGNDLGLLSDHAWVTANADGVTHPVGMKKPNAWGIYDTSGNVREWIKDWHDDEYYSRSPVQDPGGPETGYGRAYRGAARMALNSRPVRVIAGGRRQIRPPRISASVS